VRGVGGGGERRSRPAPVKGKEKKVGGFSKRVGAQAQARWARREREGDAEIHGLSRSTAPVNPSGWDGRPALDEWLRRHRVTEAENGVR
jgi:hypothetical protein